MCIVSRPKDAANRLAAHMNIHLVARCFMVYLAESNDNFYLERLAIRGHSYAFLFLWYSNQEPITIVAVGKVAK